MNRWISFLVCLALVLSSCSEGEHAHQTPRDDSAVFDGVIVAIGDSLTAGYGLPMDEAYPAQLQEALIQEGFRYNVINSGISGETSSGLRSRLDWVLKSLHPDVVIVLTGGNDGLRGIDPDVLENNLNAILSRLDQEKVRTILCGVPMLPNLGPEYRSAFEGVYPRVAAQHDVMFAPAVLLGVAGESSLNQRDGIHPTREGYAVMVKNLLPYVLEALSTTREADSSGQ